MAQFDAGGEVISLTLATGLDRTKHHFVYAHVKFDASASYSSNNYIMEMEADTGYRKGLVWTNTPRVNFRANTGNASGDTTLDKGNWHGCGGWSEPDNIDAFLSRRPFYAGLADAAADVSSGDFTGNTSNYTKIRIGLAFSGSFYDRWKGWITHLSLWECDSYAVAGAIAPDLETTVADEVSAAGATCRLYMPLIDDETVVIGDVSGSVTVTGATFPAGQDPGLSGGSPPASAAQVIACLV